MKPQFCGCASEPSAEIFRAFALGGSQAADVGANLLGPCGNVLSVVVIVTIQPYLSILSEPIKHTSNHKSIKNSIFTTFIALAASN